MPTVAELERLRALVGRLVPLTSIQRGTLVRSDDWNFVVGCVVELARAVLAGDATSVPDDHDHTDQVGVAWLDPRLRSLVERGPLTEPAMTARLAGIETRLGRLDGVQRRAEDGLGSLRARLDDIVTRDLVRERDVTTVRRLVEGRDDSRDDVLVLRETLRGLERELHRVIQISQGLVVDGQPVDVGGLTGRVQELEELRDRLRLPSGDLLDAGSLEARLTELTNTLVTEAELDTALETARAGVAPADLAALEDRVRATLTAEVNVRLDTVSGELRAEVSTRLAEVDTRLGAAVQEALPAAVESTLATVRPEIDAARRAALEESGAAADRKVADAVELMRGEVDSRVTAVSQSVLPAVTAELERQLPSQLAAVKEGISAAHQRLDGVEARLADHDRRIGDQGTRIEVVARDEAEARARLDSSLQQRLTAQEESLLAHLEKRLGEVRGELAGGLDERIATAIRDVEERTRKVATAAASEEARHAAVQLRAEMQQIAKDAVVAVRDDMQGMVASELKQQVSRVREGLVEMIRRELDELRHTLPKLVAKEVDTQLRDRNP